MLTLNINESPEKPALNMETVTTMARKALSLNTVRISLYILGGVAFYAAGDAFGWTPIIATLTFLAGIAIMIGKFLWMAITQWAFATLAVLLGAFLIRKFLTNKPAAFQRHWLDEGWTIVALLGATEFIFKTIGKDAFIGVLRGQMDTAGWVTVLLLLAFVVIGVQRIGSLRNNRAHKREMQELRSQINGGAQA